MRKMKSEMMSELDKLYHLVQEYRKSEEYRQLLAYIASFKNLSPYNAFLVVQQRPGAKFVLTPDQWRKMGREIKRHARPLVVLKPFGPVCFMYDVSDTYATQKFTPSLFEETENDLLERLAAPYLAKGGEPDVQYKALIENIGHYGIAVKPFLTGSFFAAQIERLEGNSPEEVTVDVKGICGYFPVIWKANYLVSIREDAGIGEKFASLCHELAHLFCGHLGATPNNRPGVCIPHDAAEFEAESAAWLVCSRYEVENPSERYLASFIRQNEYIPEYTSIERIFYATNVILNLIGNTLNIEDGWLYKYDEKFRQRVKELKKTVK